MQAIERLEDWISEHDHQTAIGVATSAVLQILPIAFHYSTSSAGHQKTSLAILRLVITSTCATLRHERALAQTANTLSIEGHKTSTEASASTAGELDIGGVVRAAAATAKVAAEPSFAAPRNAAEAVNLSALAYAGAALRRASSERESAHQSAYDEFLDAVLSKTVTAPAETELSKLPAVLRSAFSPVYFLFSNSAQLRDEADGTWSFWSRWYERAMAGDPLPWDLQREVALIPNAIWEQGPEAVAERIAEIEAEWAVRKFPHAEELEQQEDGRFEVRHVPDTPPSAQYTPLDPDTALDAVISETSVAPKLVWDEERSVHRIAHDPPFNKETITFVINRLELLLAAAISTSRNGITEHAYEAILIYAVLADPHQDISLTATTLQDAWVSLDHNLSDPDPAYPSDPQHLNLRDALREAVEEICDNSVIATERCKKLAKMPNIPITREMRESATGLAEAAAEFTDEEAHAVLEADAEGIETDPHPPKSKVARFFNYVATIAKHAKETLDRAQGSVTYFAKLEKFVTKVTVWIKWLLENWPF